MDGLIKVRDCKETEEILDELSKYTGYILGLLEDHRHQTEFYSKKYKNEAYYYEIASLNKILNLMRFLLK